MSTTEEPKKPGRRGFAALSPEQRQRMSSRGGKAAHAQGRAHTFTAEEARAARARSSGGRRRVRGSAAVTGRDEWAEQVEREGLCDARDEDGAPCGAKLGADGCPRGCRP